jgi:beta-glucosidase
MAAKTKQRQTATGSRGGTSGVATFTAKAPIFTTENGCASDDMVADDGKVYDTDRIVFLKSFLTQLQRATADGVPVKDYFHWSLMDNFEWMAGYGNRFGIVRVDFETQKRTPKMSAEYFRESAKLNAVA